jgi:hypothetical protein
LIDFFFLYRNLSIFNSIRSF